MGLVHTWGDMPITGGYCWRTLVLVLNNPKLGSKRSKEDEYIVIGGYEGSSCLWHETDEGFCYQFTTKIIFVVKACLESPPGMAVLLGRRLW